jgi:NhaP-type Na+/H+ or K+/H+ antiporter
MLLTFSLIILFGFGFSELAYRLKLPRIVGMLLSGIVLGPYLLNAISPEVSAISLDIRQMALIIILLRAGLSLDLQDLKKVGKPAILLSFLPATFEIIGTMILGPLLLGLTLIESALLGSILAAVSPAIVVPRMLQLIHDKRGTEKKIPHMIMAGASVDDVYVIVLFTSFITMAKDGVFSWEVLLRLPLAILIGVLAGVSLGVALTSLFKRFHIRDTSKVLLILSLSLFLLTLEQLELNLFPFSGLLATLSLGITLLTRYPVLAKRLVVKYEKIWVLSETFLFVLVGAAVSMTLIPNVGFYAVLLILGALVFRSIGVFVSTRGTALTVKEQMFTVFAYLPKATVQASIGSIPLALGISNGDTMLTLAVLAILLTAPLGAFLIDLTKHKLLKKEL